MMYSITLHTSNINERRKTKVLKHGRENKGNGTNILRCIQIIFFGVGINLRVQVQYCVKFFILVILTEYIFILTKEVTKFSPVVNYTRNRFFFFWKKSNLISRFSYECSS